MRFEASEPPVLTVEPPFVFQEAKKGTMQPAPPILGRRERRGRKEVRSQDSHLFAIIAPSESSALSPGADKFCNLSCDAFNVHRVLARTHLSNPRRVAHCSAHARGLAWPRICPGCGDVHLREKTSRYCSEPCRVRHKSKIYYARKRERAQLESQRIAELRNRGVQNQPGR